MRTGLGGSGDGANLGGSGGKARDGVEGGLGRSGNGAKLGSSRDTAGTSTESYGDRTRTTAGDPGNPAYQLPEHKHNIEGHYAL